MVVPSTGMIIYKMQSLDRTPDRTLDNSIVSIHGGSLPSWWFAGRK